MTKVAAIVPMRHYSERVKGKNYRTFNGKPLFYYIIESLLYTPAITEVVIDTDSPKILEQCKSKFPTVTLLERPEHLKDGGTPMNDVLLNAVSQIDADFYLQTHSTNPLLRRETIQNAVKTLLDIYPRYDSLFGVTRWQTRLWDSLARPINHNHNILLRTQDLPPIFEENSCIYLFRRQILEQKHNRIGDRPYLFEIDPAEAHDIDEEIDFIVAEIIHKSQHPNNT